MNSSTKCKHRPVHEIENRLYPDYDDGLFQRMYIELREGIREVKFLSKLSPNIVNRIVLRISIGPIQTSRPQVRSRLE